MQNDLLLEKARKLKLHGLVAHWEEIRESCWIEEVILWEEKERVTRGLEGRLHSSRIGRFKPLAHFDWSWPTKCDREAIEELIQLAFVKESANIILCGPNGVGKSMIAKNIAYQAVIFGLSVLFTSATHMLNELASCDGESALLRRIKYFVKPQLLVVDEIGYLSYSTRYADLLFDIVSRRYHDKPTIITTNKPFSEWNDIFPNASCVVSIIDRLVHHSEIIGIEGPSFRLKEATEKAEKRKKDREQKKSQAKNKNIKKEKTS